jgi:hypothetical protein
MTLGHVTAAGRGHPMNIEGTQLTALQTAISNILDAPIVSRFVLVAETIDADGPA